MSIVDHYSISNSIHHPHAILTISQEDIVRKGKNHFHGVIEGLPAFLTLSSVPSALPALEACPCKDTQDQLPKATFFPRVCSVDKPLSECCVA